MISIKEYSINVIEYVQLHGRGSSLRDFCYGEKSKGIDIENIWVGCGSTAVLREAQNDFKIFSIIQNFIFVNKTKKKQPILRFAVHTKRNFVKTIIDILTKS